MRCALIPPQTLASGFIGRAASVALAIGLCASSSFAAQDKPVQVQLAPATTAKDKPALSAQDKPATPAASKPGDISKEALVIDKMTTRIREEADGTGTHQTTARVRVLADAGVKDMAVLEFTYTASNQQVDIAYVRVIRPDGTVVATPAYNVQDLPADVTRTAPMYSDIHQKHVAVKGLGVGDTLEYQVTITTLKPEVPGQFWFEYAFQKDLIILDEQVDLDLPADNTVTVASADAQPTVTTAAGRKLYHWASSNLARPDPDAPPKSIKHEKPSIQVTTFSSWEQVGAWYQSLQRESLVVTPAIQAKVDALTKGLTSDDDKMHAIFNDVALHIHYVGLEFGIGRYQPHAADDVLSNEYGDCKDKHTLLAAELRAVGIEAWPVLISAGRELDPDTPSPAQFNHVITLVPLAGRLIWMDSTEEVAPVGMLIATLRDKQALAIPDAKAAYLERTPAVAPFAESARFQVDGQISDQGKFTAHVAQAYHGDVEIFLRTILRTVPQSQWKQALQRFSSAIGFGGEVSNPQISDLEKIGQPLQFSYDYEREKYGEWDDHRISPPMPPTGWALVPGIKVKKPADDPEIGSPGEQIYASTIQLPKGWSMSPPKETSLKRDWAEYHSTYSFKDGVFTAERRLTTKKIKIPLDDWDNYLDFRRAIYADEVQTAQIFNIGGTGKVYGSGSGTIRAPIYESISKADFDLMLAAAQPLRDAESILASDPAPAPADVVKALDLARKTVEDFEAKSIGLSRTDPHSLPWAQMLAYAWGTLGWAALESHDLPMAESYLRASWQVSQDKMAGYQLARLLLAKGEKTAAVHQLELAQISSIQNALSGNLDFDYKLMDRIADSYTKITGKPLTATALSHGEYNGSLRAELDKEIEIHGYTKESKLNGDVLFMVAYQEGEPVKARLLTGERAFDSMAATLESRKISVALPHGSKALLLREVRIVCSSYGGGCDAYMLLPTAIKIPAVNNIIEVSAPTAARPAKESQVPPKQ